MLHALYSRKIFHLEFNLKHIIKIIIKKRLNNNRLGDVDNSTIESPMSGILYDYHCHV